MIKRVKVLFEDNHILALEKPPGLLSQGDSTGEPSLLDLAKDYIKEKYKKPGNVYCGLVHRLDRPASGIVILTKTSKALERMNRLMREREIKKTYWAITENFIGPEQKRLVHWLKKNEEKNRVNVFKKEKKGALRSELSLNLLGRIGPNHLLEIDLITGRNHQARGQLAAEKMPIKGDVKYGYSKKNPRGIIYLHCREMKFVHPVKNEPITIVSKPPKDSVWMEFDGFFRKSND
jgi:23S rRNA pseudouridine1911/1915/1917 synthase